MQNLQEKVKRGQKKCKKCTTKTTLKKAKKEVVVDILDFLKARYQALMAISQKCLKQFFRAPKGKKVKKRPFLEKSKKSVLKKKGIFSAFFLQRMALKSIKKKW